MTVIEKIDPGFSTDHLSPYERKIAEAILDSAFLGGLEGWSTGGCQSFYSPKVWRERGEQYGTESKLIIVYDGGDLKYQISMDGCYDSAFMVRAAGGKVDNPYASLERVQEALKKMGLMIEECTCWYSAVNEI